MLPVCYIHLSVVTLIGPEQFQWLKNYQVKVMPLATKLAAPQGMHYDVSDICPLFECPIGQKYITKQNFEGQMNPEQSIAIQIVHFY